MRTIPLSRGLVATVDDEDFELASRHKWHAHRAGVKWYAATHVGGRKDGQMVYLHRLLLDAPDGAVVDHRDGDGLNNRRANIHVCSISLNNHNRKPVRREGTYRGVYWVERDRRWYASIKAAGKRRHLGTFTDPIAAAKAYDAAAISLYGADAQTNFGNPLLGLGIAS